MRTVASAGAMIVVAIAVPAAAAESDSTSDLLREANQRRERREALDLLTRLGAERPSPASPAILPPAGPTLRPRPDAEQIAAIPREPAGTVEPPVAPKPSQLSARDAPDPVGRLPAAPARVEPQASVPLPISPPVAPVQKPAPGATAAIPRPWARLSFDLTFESGSTVLSTASLATLLDFREVLADRPLVLEGWAEGREGSERRLALARAETVRRFLVANFGVEARSVVAYGLAPDLRPGRGVRISVGGRGAGAARPPR